MSSKKKVPVVGHLGFNYMGNDNIDHISERPTIDGPIGRIPSEAITLTQYRNLGGIPIRSEGGSRPDVEAYYTSLQEDFTSRPPSPSELHDSRQDGLYSPTTSDD